MSLRQIFSSNIKFYRAQNNLSQQELAEKCDTATNYISEIETGRKGVWECKTTEIVSSMAKEKWAGRLPDNYYVQLIHSLLVREDCEFAHLTALLTFKFGGKELYQQIKNYHIERSEVQEDIDYLMQEGKKFWQYVESGKRPPLRLPEL